MPEPIKPAVTDPFAADSKAYSTLFQAWLLLFLAVVCFALVNYLLSYIPK